MEIPPLGNWAFRGIKCRGFGFRISDFGFRISDFGFRVSVSEFGGFKVTNVLGELGVDSQHERVRAWRFRSGDWLLSLGFELRVLVFGLRVLGLGFWILVTPPSRSR